MPKNAQTLESMLDRLDGIVDKLESGEADIEASIKLYNQGMELSAACEKKLSEAESAVKLIMQAPDGTVVENDFEQI